MRQAKSALFNYIGYRLLLIFVLLSSLFLFLITTTPGFYIVLQSVNLFLPGHLRFQGLAGELIHHFKIAQLEYFDSTKQLSLTNLEVDWHLQELFKQHLPIKRIRIGQLNFVTHESIKEKQDKLTSLVKLPFRFSFDEVRIDKINISKEGKNLQLQNASLTATFSNQQWQVSSLKTRYQQYAISAQAQFIPSFPYNLNSSLKIEDTLSKQVGTHVRLEGDYSLYSINGEINHPFPITLHGILKNLKETEFLAKWPSFTGAIDNIAVQLGAGQLAISGQLPNLTFSGQGKIIKPLALSWQLKSQYQQNNIVNLLTVKNEHLQGLIQLLFNPKADTPIIADANLNLSTILPLEKLSSTIHVEAKDLDHLVGTLKANGHYNNQEITADFNYDPQAFAGKVQLQNNYLQINGEAQKPWNLIAIIKDSSLLHPSLSPLKTSLRLDGKLVDNEHGQLKVKVNNGFYQLPDKNNLDFQGGQLQLKLDPHGLISNGNFVLDAHKKLNLQLTLPQFKLTNIQQFAQQPILGKINLLVNSLDFIAALDPNLSATYGKLEAEVKVKGQLTKPDFSGSIKLIQAGLASKQLGVDLHPIDFLIKTDNNKWEAKGKIFAQNKALDVTGSGAFSPEINGQLNVSGDELLFINTTEYNIYLSPRLQFTFKPNSYVIRGNIKVPKALIKPQSFNNSVTLSSDIVYANKPVETNNPFHLDTNVSIEMGNEVQLLVKGMKGLLQGAVNVRQLPDGPLNASGGLSIKDGKYQAYGQDLTIDQGDLLFNGGMLFNPDLSIRAVRKFNNSSTSLSGSDQLFDFNPANMQTLDFGNKLTVGIEVTGKLASPRIKLFSNPPTLSQADILSMLLLGRPANQANKSGGQLLLAAISSMNLDAGNSGMQLLNQIKQSIGVDVNVASTSTYNKKTNTVDDSTSLVVGKSLSKRLYVSYNVGLSQADANVLTLKYLLNKFFSIQVDASTNGSGVDILYTHQKD